MPPALFALVFGIGYHIYAWAHMDHHTLGISLPHS
jgi:hypothetical protein